MVAVAVSSGYGVEVPTCLPGCLSAYLPRYYLCLPTYLPVYTYQVCVARGLLHGMDGCWIGGARR